MKTRGWRPEATKPVEAAMPDVVANMIARDEVIAAQNDFNLSVPLTEAERMLMADQFDTSITPEMGYKNQPTPLSHIEDDPFAVTTPDAVATNTADYNAQYLHYQKCQAIAALGAYDEGWKAFIELVLAPYVKSRKLDDENYKGDDRDKAFALRLRRLAADDFAKYILTLVAESAKVPKPTLVR